MAYDMAMPSAAVDGALTEMEAGALRLVAEMYAVQLDQVIFDHPTVCLRPGQGI